MGKQWAVGVSQKPAILLLFPSVALPPNFQCRGRAQSPLCSVDAQAASLENPQDCFCIMMPFVLKGKDSLASHTENALLFTSWEMPVSKQTADCQVYVQFCMQIWRNIIVYLGKVMKTWSSELENSILNTFVPEFSELLISIQFLANQNTSLTGMINLSSSCSMSWVI